MSANPIGRVVLIAAGALVLLFTGMGVAYYLAHHPREGEATRSRAASVPVTSPSLPGDAMLPETQQAYSQSEAQNRAAAQGAAGAAAAVPPFDTLEGSGASVAPQTLRPEDAAALAREQRAQGKEAEKQRQKVIHDKAQGMTKVLAAWGGVHQTAEASLQAPAPEPQKTAAAELPNPLASLPVDKVYYGLLRVYISSDEPGPVVVVIKDAPLDGARLIGTFERADEKVVIHFDRMTFQGAWFGVDAYAIDPANGRLGLATEVNRRTISRWAALLGSAMLEGAQRAYLSEGTHSSYLWGQSTTREFDDREIFGIAAGEVGRRTRRAAHEYFNRPPTVYVDPGKQLVGVLFMGPPGLKQEAGSSSAALVEMQQAAAQLRQAATTLQSSQASAPAERYAPAPNGLPLRLEPAPAE